jgi:hypothetical protein
MAIISIISIMMVLFRKIFKSYLKNFVSIVNIQQDIPQTPFSSEGLCHNSDDYLPVHHAVSRLRLQIRTCGICGEANDIGSRFLLALLSSLPVLIPPIPQQSSYEGKSINKLQMDVELKQTRVLI